VGAEPLLTVNYGTGTPEEAADWVAYVNRREGPSRPVRWWFVGNEIYGSWELGHCSGEEYGRGFVEFSDAMRKVDPDIRLIAVGDPNAGNEQWSVDMLKAAGPAVDMVSVHFYFPGAGLGRDLADTESEVHQLLLGPRTLGATLDRTIQLIDDAGYPDLPVSLDEWNLWSEWPDLLSRTHRLCDSLYFGGVFNRMIERADRVRYAMISHLVNCMAPIQTTDGRMHVTAAYLTFLLYRRSIRRFRVPVEVDVTSVPVETFPDLSIRQLGGHTGSTKEVSLLDVAATDDDSGTTVFVCSGSLEEPVRTTIGGLPESASGVIQSLCGPDPFARNGFDAPDRLGFALAPVSTDERGTLTFDLPPATVTAVQFDRGTIG
jgi:alpha-N-arabinofuranosidase